MENEMPIIPESLIKKAISLSESSNSNKTIIQFCNMKYFNGWCMKLILCKHSVCEETDDK